MQSWQACALQPARIVGQGSQCVAQHDAMPSVGTQDGIGVRLGGDGVAVGVDAGDDPLLPQPVTSTTARAAMRARSSAAVMGLS